MKSTLFLLLGFIVSQSFGQTNAPDKSWLGVSISTDINNCYLEDKSADIIPMIKDFNSSKKNKIGNSFSLSFKRNIDLHWSFETGIQYANLGFLTDLTGLNLEDQIKGARGFVNPSLEPMNGVSIRIKRIFHYAELPLRLSYHANQKPVHFCAGIGIIPGYLLQSDAKTIIHPDHQPKFRSVTTRDHSKLNLSPMLSAGLSYVITKNLNFDIEAVFRYSLLSTTNNPINTRLYNGGLRFSSYWSI